MESLGYYGSGEAIRGFDFDALLSDIAHKAIDPNGSDPRQGPNWCAFEVNTSRLKEADAFRLDLKYWEPATCEKIENPGNAGAVSIKTLNKIQTRRGKSPKTDSHVDEKDGYALVVKSGSNITKFGELLVEGDFIEKTVYDDMKAFHLQNG